MNHKVNHGLIKSKVQIKVYSQKSSISEARLGSKYASVFPVDTGCKLNYGVLKTLLNDLLL